MIVYNLSIAGKDDFRIATEVSNNYGFRKIYRSKSPKGEPCYSNGGHVLNGRWWPREISEEYAAEILNIEFEIKTLHQKKLDLMAEAYRRGKKLPKPVKGRKGE